MGQYMDVDASSTHEDRPSTTTALSTICTIYMSDYEHANIFCACYFWNIQRISIIFFFETWYGTFSKTVNRKQTFEITYNHDRRSTAIDLMCFKVIYLPFTCQNIPNFMQIMRLCNELCNANLVDCSSVSVYIADFGMAEIHHPWRNIIPKMWLNVYFRQNGNYGYLNSSPSRLYFVFSNK